LGCKRITEAKATQTETKTELLQDFIHSMRYGAQENLMNSKVILVTGASSGFGRMSAEALARAGHTVYASMRNTTGRNAATVAQMAEYAKAHNVDLRTVELDVQSQESADAAAAQVIAETGRIDVVIHNAGHMAFGPAEAFTPEQYAHLYDVNVLSTQRVNRSVLPYLRRQGQGLLLWVSSSSSAGGTPPYLAPYFAAKAAMDALAVQYAREVSRWGIETSIVVPGAFTKGTNHFVHSGKPADQARADEYHNGPYAGLPEQSLKGLASLEPADADVGEVASAIARIVGAPFGMRPFRVHIDPSQDGAEIVNGVADRVRSEMFRRIGLEDLLHPAMTERSKA
jgi:NAD(P)-dependent dehydrogenase (short-subunit alcohol dehydrogenase family)